jgi:peptide deformylase
MRVGALAALYNLSMSILKVARMGHPVLRQRAKPLDKAALRHPLLQKLIDDMIETMHEYHGVGLAAPQIHEDVRLFVGLLDEEPGPESEAIALINPEIVPEGCLSIPDIRGLVPRYNEIVVRALDREGKPLELRLKKFAARVAQHEADHLDGVLFFDRMTSLQSLTYLEEYSRYHARDDD